MSPVNSPDFKCTRLMVTCHAVAVYRGGLSRPNNGGGVVSHHFQAKKSKPILQATAEGDTVFLFLANEHCTVLYPKAFSALRSRYRFYRYVLYHENVFIISLYPIYRS